ncbi:MAG: PTS sugar transporter subunit IIB [Desulfomonile sp.]|jgi:mannose/fructose/N-acetylgalactosamine-specific phosphotransferase system component IIB
MPIVLFRVDDRFVHGQILQGWLPSTRAQELFIANDALAQDDVQKMIMECAIPYNVKIVIDTVDEVARLLKTEEVSDIRRMVIVDTPVDALRLIRAGVRFGSLNLGNMSVSDAKKPITRSLALGEESIGAIREILKEGIGINVQSVPFEKPIDFCDLCDSYMLCSASQ